jgi:glycerophosphoryl diester phosphodiesterase
MFRTLLTAHSGCDGTNENSMEFVSYALGLDVGAIEVDVRKSSEGALVLAHDDRPANATLRDVFLKLKEHPEKKLNCDLKQDNLELDVWALAKQTGSDKQIIFSGTVSRDAAKLEPDLYRHADWFVNIELLFPKIKALGLAEAVSMLGHMEMADKLGEFITVSGAQCVNTHHSIASTPLYRELMIRGIPISVWTPDDGKMISSFLEDGVYNITTRNAKGACGILHGRRNL